MKTIAPAQLQQLTEAQPNLPLSDVPKPVQYPELHARAARNAPLNSPAPEKLFAWRAGAGLVFARITDSRGMGLLLAKLPWKTRDVRKGSGASLLRF
jgi:hypothetical protein